MDAQEAKDAIRACVALCGGCDFAGNKCHEREKGFLDGAEAERKRTSALVEAARAVVKHYAFVHMGMAAQTGMRTGGQILIEKLDTVLHPFEPRKDNQ